MADSAIVIRPVGQPGDLGWMVQAHGEVYAAEYGWDFSFEALVDECLRFAATAGYRRMRLWTNHPLAAARHIYLSRGFTLTEEERHHSYGADLTGQIYELELA